jgi:hypothetical protein
VSAPTTVEWLRTAVARVGVGSGRLGVHLGRRTVARARTWYEGLRDWVRPASGFDKGFRLGLLVGALLIVRKIATGIGRWAYHRIESGAWGPFLFAAAGVWIVAAYRCGLPGWEPKQRQPKEAPEAEPEGGEEMTEEVPAASLEKPLLPGLSELRIALARVGTPHAHLAILATDIGTTAERVREALEKWQIPVEAVRMQGRGTSTGVKGGDAIHPALALRPEDAAVVAAGQPGNNSSNNAFDTVDDESNPARSHVVWRDQQAG